MIKLRRILEDSRMSKLVERLQSMHEAESESAKQAHELGLTAGGWGTWKDKNGRTVARTLDGKLVKIDDMRHDDIDRLNNGDMSDADANLSVKYAKMTVAQLRKHNTKHGLRGVHVEYWDLTTPDGDEYDAVIEYEYTAPTAQSAHYPGDPGGISIIGLYTPTGREIDFSEEEQKDLEDQVQSYMQRQNSRDADPRIP